jgi:hypothetical protein
MVDVHLPYVKAPGGRDLVLAPMALTFTPSKKWD